MVSKGNSCTTKNLEKLKKKWGANSKKFKKLKGGCDKVKKKK